MHLHRDAGEVISGDGHLPSLAVPPADHDAPIAQVYSPPQESSVLDKGVRGLTQVDEGNLRERDQAVLASIVDKGKIIMINDSKSDDEDHVAPIDIPTE